MKPEQEIVAACGRLEDTSADFRAFRWMQKKSLTSTAGIRLSQLPYKHGSAVYVEHLARDEAGIFGAQK